MDIDSFYGDLLEFTKQRLECHGENPANIINIVFKVFKTLKNQYRVTKCAKCHLFKNAATQCPNKECSKHMFIAQCKECKKTSVRKRVCLVIISPHLLGKILAVYNFY